MIIKKQEVVNCKKCGETFRIFEYVGWPRCWYSENYFHLGEGECLKENGKTTCS